MANDPNINPDKQDPLGGLSGNNDPKPGPDWEKAAEKYKASRDGWKKKAEDVEAQLASLQKRLEGALTQEDIGIRLQKGRLITVRNFEVDQTDIAEKTLEVIEGLIKKADKEKISCEYEFLPTNALELPCVTMTTLPGSPIEKTYLDGSYVANYRFGLTLRQTAEDMRKRLDARAFLQQLAKDFCETAIDLGEDCQIWYIKIDNLPSRIADDDNFIDYQVTLTVQYKVTH